MEEGVKLAPINISGDDIYVFDGEGRSLARGEGEAEFFVTIYTRLEKDKHVFFENSCPTIIVSKDQIQGMSAYLNDGIQ